MFSYLAAIVGRRPGGARGGTSVEAVEAGTSVELQEESGSCMGPSCEGGPGVLTSSSSTGTVGQEGGEVSPCKPHGH
jgi:hypothetical protein